MRYFLLISILLFILLPGDIYMTTWKRLPQKSVTKNITNFAKTCLSQPLGAEIEATIDDQDLKFVLEKHYHPSPGPNDDPSKFQRPFGWHKGVSVFYKIEEE